MGGVFFKIKICKSISDDISQFGKDFDIKVGELKQSMSSELNELKNSHQEIKGNSFHHPAKIQWV